MDYTPHINHLRSFVCDIQRYYERSNHAMPNSHFSMPRSMVAFMLAHFPQKAGDKLLDLLLERGDIISLEADTITFSAAFLSQPRAVAQL